MLTSLLSLIPTYSTGFAVNVDSILHRNFGSSQYGGHCAGFASLSSLWKAIPWQSVMLTGLQRYAGDDIEVIVRGADCNLGAHGGYLYVDGEEWVAAARLGHGWRASVWVGKWHLHATIGAAGPADWRIVCRPSRS